MSSGIPERSSRPQAPRHPRRATRLIGSQRAAERVVKHSQTIAEGVKGFIVSWPTAKRWVSRYSNTGARHGTSTIPPGLGREPAVWSIAGSKGATWTELLVNRPAVRTQGPLASGAARRCPGTLN